ncbi:helix-turn-helix transcriptional regulator [Streptomyces sp. H10-C2]|uniref:helix-turn-helix domain-containing protein n=1 Tax=unclassified Streptomyces TaxID=2593676 RepID=UPI0024BAA294|nr:MULTISPECIES: helix-turn-helix transcriptional regulator [unclassified Streptomyces]MDJ0340378.1 helix-turn-helix transcriptional regulator [Streptomyces sp. PH10-H1]MDJ0368174.1 helix-turn-helix transcriptional regulator [Streptomyces sp. H10-C2]
MPPRSEPSERQRRLGAELRKLRNRAGLSGDRAGALLDADRTRISNIEAGRVDVSRNRLYMLLREYGCPPGPLFDALMEMAQERGKGWWDEYRDVMGRNALDLAELESRSRVVRIHEPLFIPGMLQTADYAREVIAATEPDPERVERYAQFRLARQQILTGGSPPAYHAVIYEAALRVEVGGTRIMRKQLLRLMEIARLPHVTLQVFPFARGAYAGFARPFILFEGSVPELGTVYRENPMSAAFVGVGEQLDDYAKMFERLTELALAPVDPQAAPESHEGRDSLSLIQHIMYNL